MLLFVVQLTLKNMCSQILTIPPYSLTQGNLLANVLTLQRTPKADLKDVLALKIKTGLDCGLSPQVFELGLGLL